MDYKELITIQQGKRSGRPCIRDTRLAVHDVLGYLAAGMSIEQVLYDFPQLTWEDILACFAYAANFIKGSDFDNG